jgi:cyclopropane fatty-acyl-phospholipid synthase-like methyltransferase
MEPVFDISLYNDEFFQWHLQYAREYSIKTMNWFVDTYRPSSVCDVGCGIGSYLEAAYHKGIEELKGYDIGGEHARKYTPNEIQRFIEYRDCTKEMFTRQYDCVLSFETAEHVEPTGSEMFVANIAGAAKKNRLILFTAAPPGQEGCGHINCQPEEYWIDLFIYFGAVPSIEHTSFISAAWKEIGCPDYIGNNLIVFIKQ